ncbi:MAG: glycosyltransferase [Planctomycetota bacterium]|jgi:GT2 family glycosyltransferase
MSAPASPRTLLIRALPDGDFPPDLGGEVVHRLTLVGEGAGTLGLEAGAIGRSHGLIEGIGDAIEEHAVEAVALPEHGGDDDQRALVTAAASACSVRGVSVSLGGADLAPAAEVQRELRAAARARSEEDPRTVTAVISAWNKREDVRANLLGIRAQTRPFDDVVVVDNHSDDGTPQMIREEFPEVRLVVMPNSAYGACETFNVGFSTALTEYIAILDDDVVLTPWWLERSLERMGQEPETTAVVSTKVVEPGMPDSFRDAEALNRERYMSTFRGCASLARKSAIDEAGGYDERLFIYGNERDLTCRLLNLGYRVLQFPGAETFHRTPFGLQMGKRSLFYHARNAWIGMLKYAPARDLARMPFLVITRVLLRGRKAEEAGEVTDAVGTIGVGKSLRETDGAWWIVLRALGSVLYNVPYCLKHRQPVEAPDFELPLQ